MSVRTMSLKGRGKGRQAANSSAMDAAARWGFAARGLIYLLIGLLALQIAFGGGGKQADRGGALAEIGEKPMGSFVLWALGIGLVGMSLWRLSEALFGASGPDGHKTSKRLLSAARFVFYGFVAYSVLSFAAGDKGGSSGDQQSQDITAKAMEQTGGQWIVGVAGAVIVGAGLWVAVRAIRRDYHKHLKLAQMSRKVRQFFDVTGVGGGVARGALFAGIGAFVVQAAIDYEPDKAKGFDDTLRSFTDTPVGPWLLVLVALGLVLFGLFSFAMARYRKV